MFYCTERTAENTHPRLTNRYNDAMPLFDLRSTIKAIKGDRDKVVGTRFHRDDSQTYEVYPGITKVCSSSESESTFSS